MLDMIDAYLTDQINPTQGRVIRDALETFDVLGFEYEADYVNVLTMEGSHSKESTPAELVAHVLRDVTELLETHGLTVTEETSFRDRCKVLEGLVNLTYLRDYSYITGVLSTDVSDIDKILDILESVTCLHAEDLSYIIHDVEEVVLSRLEEYISKYMAVPGTDNTLELYNKIVRRFKRFINEHPRNEGLNLVEAGNAIGLKFVDYLPYIYLGNPDKYQLVIDVYSALIISTDGFVAPIQVYEKYVSPLMSDPMIDGQVLQGVRGYLLEFN